jgi:hypothetical protein
MVATGIELMYDSTYRQVAAVCKAHLYGRTFLRGLLEAVILVAEARYCQAVNGCG